VLRDLAGEGHALYYVTGRPHRRTAEAFLARFGFPEAPLYSDFVGPGESWKKVRLFREIREREGGARGIAVGDLVGDALAAKEAGLFAVGTLQAPERVHRRAELEEVCDALIAHLWEFPVLLEQVRRDWEGEGPVPDPPGDSGTPGPRRGGNL
jgi:phosphoglycolate phosphatase-like HAD superfamily hydrolase